MSSVHYRNPSISTVDVMTQYVPCYPHMQSHPWSKVFLWIEIHSLQWTIWYPFTFILTISMNGSFDYNLDKSLSHYSNIYFTNKNEDHR